MAEQPWAPLRTGPSLADQAYVVLRDLVTSGALAPAERVTERGLAERLGVSPTPVREAISRLIHERLLVRVDGRTLRVTDPSVRRLREMSLIQGALRSVAARLAAEHASDSELADIVRVHRASRMVPPGNKRSANAAAQARHEFHEMIVLASHSPSLIDMVATAEAFGRVLRLRAQRAAGAAETIQRAVDDHEGIVQALIDRDGERAELLMRDHERLVGERYLAFTEDLRSQGADLQE